MTERAATLSPRSRSGLVPVVLAVLVPVLLAAGTGNSFAAHMGAGPGAADHRETRTAVGTGPARDTAGSSASTGTVPHDAQSSHVLHLLGGCIAVLGATLLLLGAGRGSGERPRPTAPAATGVTVPGAHPWWRPPALSPPTTSPVLRT